MTVEEKVCGENVNLGKSITLGSNVKITGKNIRIEDGVVIGDNTQISATDIFIGFKSKIDRNCDIILSGPNSKFAVGDNFYLGNDSRILSPTFLAGDYVVIHNHALVNGGSSCIIGHNFWAGQNCTLNSNEKLTIGNGVGMGTYSSIWTHGFFGEILEGCNVFKVAPVSIEDDVWILGAFNVISPGITLGKRSLIMTGSVVTKSVEPFHCVAGNPAKDITDRISPYKEITLDEKYELMKQFVQEFADTHYHENWKRNGDTWTVGKGHDQFEIKFSERVENDDIGDNGTTLVITKNNRTTKTVNNITIFDISTKQYTKRRTDAEIKFIKFLSSYRARFIPKKDGEGL